MLVRPIEVRVRYAELLANKGIAQSYINNCQKYLRYYLDFCHKYRHEAATVQRVEAFLLKLAEKKQTKRSILTRRLLQRFITVTRFPQ